MGNIVVCVLSYNRGELLRNCLGSIDACMPDQSVIIMDDGSTDIETLDVIEEYSSKYSVVRPVCNGGEARHGGLYQNMQRMVDESDDDALVLFVQDDMQIVRAIESIDVAEIDHYYSSRPDAVFLYPGMIRGTTPGGPDDFAYDPTSRVYYRRRNYSYYSDLCIVNVARFRSSGMRFSESECSIGRSAREVLGPMGYMANPFVAWLPYAPNYRGKRESVAMKVLRQFGKAGFYPINLMDTRSVTHMRERDPAILPVAENWLTVEALSESRKPWHHDPLGAYPRLKRLQSIEFRLRSLPGRVLQR